MDLQDDACESARDGHERDEIIGAIDSWLQHERRRAWELAANLGIPASVQISEVIGEEQERGNIQSRSQAVDRSSFGVFPQLQVQLDAVDSVGIDLSNLLARTFGERCRIFWPYGLMSGDEPDNASWLRQQYGLLARTRADYLFDLPTLDRDGASLRRRLARELYELLAGDMRNRVTLVPVNGVRPETDPVTTGDVTLRFLTALELGAQMTWWSSGFEPGRRVTKLIRIPDMSLARYGLEVTEQGSKYQQVMGQALAERVVLALELLGYEPSGSGDTSSWDAPGPTMGIAGGRVRMPRHGQERVCSQTELARAVDLAYRIPSEVFRAPTRKLALALHRFYLGVSDDNAADALIDFAIALETIILQGATTESTFRFRILGAHFLSSDDDARRKQLFAELRDIYRTRSMVVHGGELPSAAVLVNMAQLARQLAAQALLKVLERGWPDQTDLEGAALGSRPAVV